MKGKEQTVNPSAISYTTDMAQVDWAAMKGEFGVIMAPYAPES